MKRLRQLAPQLRTLIKTTEHGTPACKLSTSDCALAMRLNSFLKRHEDAKEAALELAQELNGGRRELMQDEDKIKIFRVDFDKLPAQFPTHLHSPEFWEALGRAVATFGFLEDTLAKAIFSFTATRQYPETEIEAAFEEWLVTLEQAPSDPLGKLIKSYEKAVREHPKAPINSDKLDELIGRLREASTFRNALCHASWNRRPDEQGRSLPWFVKKYKGMFETPIGLAWLVQMQRHTTELACFVMETVTLMGYQFPGSKGPGKRIW